MNTENKQMLYKLLPIILFGVIILLVALYGFFFLNRPDTIMQGEADVTEVRISSKVPGRIERFFVEEGDYVKKGDTLAILSIPDINAKLMQASAAEKGAEAMNKKAIAGVRSEEKQAVYELWQQAEAALDIAKKSYDRIQRLFEKGVVTAQKHDEVEANYRVSLAREKAAKSQYDMVVNGAQLEDKEAASAMVRAAQGAVAEVQSYITESYLISPLDGRVSDRFPNEGELVGTGAPVMNISNLNDKWGTFNIREDKLAKYKVGEVINVYVPAINKNVDMKIYQLKDLGSYAAWKATKTLGQYDRKTFQVKAHFVTIEDALDIYAGMSLIIKE
jgi:HlyD family secretion protein